MRRNWIASEARRVAGEAIAVAATPVPSYRLIRIGLTSAGVLGIFALAGNVPGGLLAAGFASLILFVDQPRPLPDRLGVIAVAALAAIMLGALGSLAADRYWLILAVTLVVATAGGAVQGSVAGPDILPRQALVAFLVCAYVPEIGMTAFLPAAAGAVAALAGVMIEGALKGSTLPDLRTAWRTATFPMLSYAPFYGGTAAASLLIAGLSNAMRPFWVAIAALFVMMPSAHGEVVIVAQRMAGTIAGVFAAFLVVGTGTLLDTAAPLYGAVIALPFLWPLGFARNHGLGVAAFTAWILILLDLLTGSGSAQLYLARLADTALGVALALAGTLLWLLAVRRR